MPDDCLLFPPCGQCRGCRLAAMASVVRQVIAEMTAALQSGALFNPEMFGSMLRDSDNPILRWREMLDEVV